MDALVVVVVVAIAVPTLWWWWSRRRSAPPRAAAARSTRTARDVLAELEGLLADSAWSDRHTDRWKDLVDELAGTKEGWVRHGDALGERMDRWYQAHPIVFQDTSAGFRVTDPLLLDTKSLQTPTGPRPWSPLVRSLDFRQHGKQIADFGVAFREVMLEEVLPLLRDGDWRRLESFDPEGLVLEGDDAIAGLVAFLERVPHLRHLVFWKNHGFSLGAWKPGSAEADAAYAIDCRTHVCRLRQLGAASWAAQLETLRVSEIFDDWDAGPAEEGLRALGAFRGLRRLDVSQCIHTAARADALLSSPWSSLETLRLGHIGSVDNDVPARAAIAEVFATTDHLPALAHLQGSFGLAGDHPARQRLAKASFELR